MTSQAAHGFRDSLRDTDVIFLSHRAQDCLPVRREVALSSLWACEGGPDAVLLAGAGELRSPELMTPIRRSWTSSNLDALIPQNSSHHSSTRPCILAYCATRRWEEFARRAGIRLAASPARLKARLDDKISTRDLLSSHGVPVPRSRAISSRDLAFDSDAAEFGLPYFIQQPYGSTGEGTYMIQEPQNLEFALARKGQPRWLVSEDAGGIIINSHGLVRSQATTAAPPSIQVTGVPELTDSRTRYCGNDFGAAETLPDDVRGIVRTLTEDIGNALRLKGWRGIYGVDFALRRGDVRVLEVNPRLQGSTWLLGELERAVGRTPLMLQHFELWLRSSHHDVRVTPDSVQLPSAAHLVVYAAINAPRQVNYKFEPGIYRMRADGDMQYERPGAGVLECRAGEFLLFGLPPRPLARIEQGAPLARVASRERLASNDGRSLTPFGRSIVGAVRQSFRPC